MTLPLWSDGEAGWKQPPRQLTLVRLSGEIARSLAGVGRVAVEGEVYRPQTSRAGRIYFTLRDRAAQMPIACPARSARRCRAVDGQRVVVVGTLVWGNDRGQLVLEAEEVTPVGEGAVAAMIAEARARLAADGLLDRVRRPVPRLPRVIGVVCGSEAAVRRDIESVVAARYPGYPLDIEETTVSGPGAALSIQEALARVASRPGVDVVVLARGGGDATALLPWSDELLCRAIASCPVPVVSAIGHEPDHPLCDEVADLRCGTPSIAAHTVVPDRQAMAQELTGLLDAANRAIDGYCNYYSDRLGRAQPGGALDAGLERASARLHHGGDLLGWQPSAAVARARHRLGTCDWRRPTIARVLAAHNLLQGLHRQATALSPQHVLDRGFAIVRRADGAVVRGPDEVAAGELLELTVARGLISARARARGQGSRDQDTRDEDNPDERDRAGDDIKRGDHR